MNDKTKGRWALCLYMVKVHPNDNTATVWVQAGDLVRIIREHGNPVNVVKID